jgi:hypothetical protein
MAYQQVQFEFPDPDKAEAADKGVKEKDNGDFEITIEGRADPLKEDKPVKPAKAEKEESDLDIEVVDDRSEDDRGKQKSKAPMELTDDEMEQYSERVKKRLQHFSKGFHDQRRAAESAERERQEALRYAQQLVEENKKLKGTVNKNQEVLLEQAKKQVEQEILSAKGKYKRAYEAGDSKALVEAQEALTNATLKADRVKNITIPPLQEEDSDVQTAYNTPEPSVDTRATAWQAKNKWFGEDDEMTSFALGLHQKLVKQGVNPQSDDYYEKINSRMRQLFPEQFTDESNDLETEEPRRKANVVAPATRSVAPKKITLTRTQVALAKKLGVSLEDYAKQVALEIRKQNG